MGHGARAGHDDRAFGNDQRLPGRRLDDDAVDQVVDRCGAGEYRARGNHRALLDHGAFVDTGVATHQHIVFDDDGQGADGFEHAANLRGGADVDPGPNLRARTNQRVRVHQRALTHVRADVDVHRRHADHASSDVGAAANRRPPWDDANAGRDARLLDRLRVLVTEWQAGGQVHDVAETKAEQDALLHPRVHPPPGRGREVGLRRPHGARLERGFQFAERRPRGRLVGAGTGGDQRLDVFLECHNFIR